MKSLKYIAILLVIFAAELAATVLPPTSRGAYSSGRRLIGQTITFTGSGSFDNDSQTGEYGPIWLWDFEYDGTNFSGDIQTGSMTVTHVYNTPGVYKVGVQYRDDDEQWGSVYTFTITINRIDRYYYVKDHLGSIRQTVNGSGAIVAARDYYPYGETLREYNSGQANEKYTFTEKEKDVETSFFCFGARYYDPILGIWLQRDPLASKYPEWSPYNYCVDNPLVIIDPNGKEIKIKRIESNGGVYYEITYTATLMDKSETYDFTDEQLNEIKQDITSQLYESFEGSSDDEKATWCINVDIQAGGTPREGDNEIQITDLGKKVVDGKEVYVAGNSKLGGKVQKINSDIVNSGKHQQIGRTGAHEFGHGARLNHPKDESNKDITTDTGNLMQQSRYTKGTKIEQKQVETMYNELKKHK